MNTLFKTTALCATLTCPAFAASEIILADFEKSSYDPWIETGEAFGAGPAQGALPGQMGLAGFKGKGLVNTFFNGDDSTGTLTSPEFRIERKFIAFLIGGGKREHGLGLQLLVDGKVVRSATGSNDQPGGSEDLQQESWDVSDLAGKKAVLKIVDEAKGGWGHINVDHIVQTDTRPKGMISDAERTLVANTQYLNIPIKNGAPKRVVTLFVDGKKVVRNDIELADGAPDWWAPMDVSEWKGKKLTLRVDKLHEDSKALSAIVASNEMKDSGNLYEETQRGQFHFSPKRGWNNDPNGMVYYNGEYHLFFQHNPYGWGWGNMHWGHAVSKDLVHWEELSPKLLPDDMGPMFSGGAVVDHKNTSGFGKDGKPPMVLFYTAAGNPTVQGMAYSTDGRTFTKYEGNPILKEITPGNRDPKVVWHEPTKQWVMVLWVEVDRVNTMQFFTSPNLKDWTFVSRTDGFFECPEFFEAPVDGDESNKKWVLIGASSEYKIGSFDGKTYTPETPLLPGHRGKDFYAAQAFTNQPDGRHILIGWWRTETRGMPFNQSMSIPLDLHLIKTDDGPRMTFTPVKELEVLRAKSHKIGALSLKPGDKNPLDDISAELVEVRAEFEPGDAEEIVFNIRDAMVIYDAKKQELSVNGHRAPAPLIDGKQRLTIYCDRIGIEAFASDGQCFLPLPFNTKKENRRFYLESRGGEAKFTSLDVHELRSAWKK
ncbi:glycoside hydrolase family 32 protein [Luteolibacter flavescens]|uniref:Glycoside hydrolase family 32 protein n=1 Tax=Luteolibacter flavescens TaxID=1859460 RepID=A0ABT3FVR9_9BACT|nr:glycoside hydrolase family 32 protein [Luteolibacter flavescens]MCW1887642.1 glycoside hydrolase family 32 protein [Luteolibacter flavescens]